MVRREFGFSPGGMKESTAKCVFSPHPPTENQFAEVNFVSTRTPVFIFDHFEVFGNKRTFQQKICHIKHQREILDYLYHGMAKSKLEVLSTRSEKKVSLTYIEDQFSFFAWTIHSYLV